MRSCFGSSGALTVPWGGVIWREVSFGETLEVDDESFVVGEELSFGLEFFVSDEFWDFEELMSLAEMT